MIALYNLLLVLATVLASPYWLLRLLTSARHRNALAQRLGAVPARLRDAPLQTVWVHAVSVGEVMAVAPLVHLLRQQLEGKYRVVVSTTTATGQKVARDLFGADSVFYCPLDYSWVVERYVRALRPRLLVLTESEFWPNLVTRTRASGAQIAVVNARVSDRSYPRYCRLRRFWRRVYRDISAFLAASELDARRLLAMGVPRNKIRVAGNMKFDLEAPAETPIVRLLREHLPPGAPVLICGSTLDPEERELMHSVRRCLAFLPNLVTIFAPRHPERFDAVAAMLPPGRIRRSEWAANPSPILPGSYFLLDSVGELASVYAVGNVAFIGGSLVPAGGHNPVEPAMAGLPIVMGLSVENFRTIVGVLEHSGALLCVSPEDLTERLMALLRDRTLSTEIGRRGRAALQTHRGATGRSAKALLELLQSSA